MEVLTLVRGHPAADVDDRGLGSDVLQRAAIVLAPADLAAAEQRGRNGDVPAAVARLLEALARAPALEHSDEPTGQAREASAASRQATATRPQALVEPLSERELEVLRLVAQGLSNKQIAARLIIAPGTVKAHLHHICGKLEAPNRTAAVARARELQLL